MHIVEDPLIPFPFKTSFGIKYLCWEDGRVVIVPGQSRLDYLELSLEEQAANDLEIQHAMHRHSGEL